MRVPLNRLPIGVRRCGPVLFFSRRRADCHVHVRQEGAALRPRSDFPRRARTPGAVEPLCSSTGLAGSAGSIGEEHPPCRYMPLPYRREVRALGRFIAKSFPGESLRQGTPEEAR